MEPFDRAAQELKPMKMARIAGFLQRLGALAVDALFLNGIGYPLGFLLGERFAPVGTPARLVGLLVIVPYLAVLGSEIGNGQTLGKKVFKLSVVDVNGRPLPLDRSIVRASLLALPWILSNIRFGSVGPLVLAALWASGVLVFGVGGAIAATYALNRGTRQAFHDLLVGSYVVHAEDVGLPVPAASTRRPLVGGAAWVALVAVATLVIGLAGRRFLEQAYPPALLETVLAIPGASSALIKKVVPKEAPAPGMPAEETLAVVLWYRGPEDRTSEVAGEVAAAVLRHHPDATKVPKIGVTVVRGWDVGIAWKTRHQSFAKAPAEWRAELGP